MRDMYLLFDRRLKGNISSIIPEWFCDVFEITAVLSPSAEWPLLIEKSNENMTSNSQFYLLISDPY